MDSKKIALITGITGQDGAYLSAFLLGKGYDVHGLVRWDSYADPIEGVGRLSEFGLLDGAVTLHMSDLTDAQAVTALIKRIRPDEIYNLAALSQVAVSFETPASTLDINTKGTLAVLEAVRLLDMQKTVRIYQASSSEMFGNAPAPQNEETSMQPCSPYGVAKLAAYWLARTYRDSYGIHVSNGVLFNHESPVRGEDFVTRKITKAVAEIEAGRTLPLSLGNIDSVRDWGHARDYVRGMWMMLQQDAPDDYVLATGEARTVREFVTLAFDNIGVSLDWQGDSQNEIAVNRKTKAVMVQIDPALFRPIDVHYLLGDASKANAVLGWKPEVGFELLVRTMLDADRAMIQKKMGKEDGVKWQKTG